MKTFIGKLFLFLLLLFASDYLLGIIVSKYHLQSNNINLQNANYGFLNKTNDDLLFFGASEVSHSFVSTRVNNQTGLSSYNLASDGCGIYYQYPLLETILEKHTPKIILISAYQLTQNDSDYITRMYPYYNNNQYVKQIVDTLHKNEFVKLSLQGYVYNSQIIRIFDGRNNNEKGYVPLTPKKIESKNSVLPDGIDYPIDTETINYFTKFIKKAKESGAIIYIYVPPILEKVNSNYLNTIKSITQKTGARLLDFSKDEFFLNNRELFNDRIHLNHAGAELLTDKFIKIIGKDSQHI